GKKLQLKRVVKVNAEIASLYNSYSTSEVIDPVDNSLHTFQTMVTDAGKEKKASLILLTKICRIKPQIPDDFYKTDMPDWPFNDGVDNPHLYQVKESELVDNEWIYLYAEAALFSEWRSEMSDYTPFKMKKVMSSTKLKSSNAIFYMIFKVRGGP
ncbi:hypothetical protein BRARA_D02443, partial [Brassica rapa]